MVAYLSHSYIILYTYIAQQVDYAIYNYIKAATMNLKICAISLATYYAIVCYIKMASYVLISLNFVVYHVFAGCTYVIINQEYIHICT